MQSDLFGSVENLLPGSSSRKNQFLERFRVSLRLDQLMIAVIVGVILFTIVFSFGVEKGKHFAWKEIQAEREKRETMIREFRAQLLALQRINPPVAVPQKVQEAKIQPVVSETRTDSPAVLNPAPAEGDRPASVEPAEQAVIRGKYTIQSVTYKTETEAQHQIKKMTDAGLIAFVIPSGKYLQVCIDAFESKQDAVSKLKELKSQGLVPRDAYVRNIPQKLIASAAI